MIVTPPMIQETYSLIDDEVSVKISGSAAESLRTKRIKRTGLRVYKDGCLGVLNMHHPVLLQLAKAIRNM